jgi:hypothetical protein
LATVNGVEACAFGPFHGPLQVQAGEWYPLLAGRSAFSRWRFLSAYLLRRDMSRVSAIFVIYRIPHAKAEVKRFLHRSMISSCNIPSSALYCSGTDTSKKNSEHIYTKTEGRGFLALTTAPHHNQQLFSDHYFDEIVPQYYFLLEDDTYCYQA